jgi:hypothetical protein
MGLARHAGALGRLALVFGVAPHLFPCVSCRLAGASLALVHAPRTFGQVPLFLGHHALILGHGPLVFGDFALAFRDVALLLGYVELPLGQILPVPWRSAVGFRCDSAGIAGVRAHL